MREDHDQRAVREGRDGGEGVVGREYTRWYRVLSRIDSYANHRE